MRYILIVVLALFMTGAPALASSGPPGFADLAENLLPSVVNISSTQKVTAPEDYPDLPEFPPGSPFEDFFEKFMERRDGGMPRIPPASLGSGFIIDAENGYIVTNNHVVKDADEVRVTFHNDVTVTAEVLGRDEKTDLALIQIDVAETGFDLRPVSFGRSDRVRIGDWVIAIGNPFGLGGTVTAGIVSARQRDINAGPYDDFLQTDASINRGNSGGPMFDLEGRVIGINTAIFSPSGGSVGIGFAIPSDLARPVIKQLIKYGHTRRGWLGVKIQSVTDDIAMSLGLKDPRGALVAGVTSGGPAAKAGIETGDIILRFNGREVGEMRDLPRMVAETEIESQAEVVVWRGGREVRLEVTIGELEEAERQGLLDTGRAPDGKGGHPGEIEVEPLGFTLSALDAQTRQRFDIGEDAKGVAVTAVADHSPAARQNLQPGDVIVEINQQAVEDPAVALEMIEAARKSGRANVLLLVNHQGLGDTRFVAPKFE